MELKRLDKSVLKLWYIRAAIPALLLVGVFVGLVAVLNFVEVPGDVRLVVLMAVEYPWLCFSALF